MFSLIDNQIIQVFQWAIRQLELFSFITRKIILNLLLFLLMVLVVLRTCIGIQLVGIHSSIGTWIVLGFFLTLPYFLGLYNGSKAIQPANLLPKEIVTRWLHRITSILLVGLGAITFLLWLGLKIRDQEDVFMFLIIKIIFYEGCFDLIIEYILCTKSLPPGEKEKRKIEKELRRALPSGT